MIEWLELLISVVACYVIPVWLTYRIIGPELSSQMIGAGFFLTGIFSFVFCVLFGLPLVARNSGIAESNTVPLISGIMIAVGIVVFLFGDKKIIK